MPTSVSKGAPAGENRVTLDPLATFPRLRALTWHDDYLYASRGYSVMRSRAADPTIEWEPLALFRPVWWRSLTSAHPLSFRLVRDGFHALACLSDGTLIGAVPHAIVVARSGEKHFRISHRITRGTRPLHFAVTPDQNILFGEYFDNRDRSEVHIYASADRGEHWQPAYTFPGSAIRHVHNIVYDRWQNCLWISTGDEGPECRILRASCDLKDVQEVIAGNQQARSVALLPRQDGIYFSSDTPMESNHIYHLDRAGRLSRVADLSASSIYGCSVGRFLFFSTMIEPSAVNHDDHVRLHARADGSHWSSVLEWPKDFWSPKYFQFGNAFLPDGTNATDVLAVSTIAVRGGDGETRLWRVIA